MNKNLILTVFCLGAIFFSFAQSSYDRKINDIANEYNSKLPIMVDKTTKWENVRVLPGKIYQYNYTLINETKGYLDIEVFRNTHRPSIVNGIRNYRNKSGFKFFKDNNVSFEYNYKDRNGKFLLKIIVTPYDYNR